MNSIFFNQNEKIFFQIFELFSSHRRLNKYTVSGAEMERKPDFKNSSEKDLLIAAFFNDFNARYPADKDCVEEFYRLMYGVTPLVCSDCRSEDIKRGYGSRLCHCMGCEREFSFTTGTFFERMKIPRVWLFIIQMAEQGYFFSSSSLHRNLKISQSAALQINKKLMIVLEHNLRDELGTFPSEAFLVLICKRSIETPARMHPRAEIVEFYTDEFDAHGKSELGQSSQQGDFDTALHHAESSNANRGSASHQGPASEVNSYQIKLRESFEIDGPEQRILAILSDTPIDTDSLCQQTGLPIAVLSAALTMLELGSMATRVPGDKYVLFKSEESVMKRADSRNSGSANAVASDCSEQLQKAIDFVLASFHGISRKYLQCYMALHWCHVARNRWTPGSVFAACLSFGPLTYKRVVSYVSSYMINMTSSQCS